ncbi:MAG: ATP-dependent nuclease [Thermoplasmata archaeon]
MIKKLKIQNFRSIRDLEVELDKINAFIGPNNAGKSNIMKALNLILGEAYPTVKSFDEKDFHMHNTDNPIVIEVIFDGPLNYDNRVYGFKLEFDGNQFDYVCINQNGRVLIYDGVRPIKVSKAMKEEVTLMYLSLDRQATQQIRASQWTLYGKLLKYINSQIDQNKKEALKNQVKEILEKSIYSDIKILENALNQHIQEQTGLSLGIDLSILDELEITKNLRPYIIEGNFKSDAEDVGAGVQSALSIAIARAYAQIVRQPLIIAIEEPELYLHPHGCRHFYKRLKEMADNQGIQIIYTTHERSFVNISEFKSIHLVRKENNKTRIYSGGSLSITKDFDQVKLASKFDEYINEVFFAEHVILVEGFSDKVACKLALEKLGVDVDLKNISIIECGSKTAIEPIARVLKHFGIKTYVLIDSDAQLEIDNLQQLLGQENVFVQNPDLEGMLGISEKLNKEKTLRILPNYFNTYEIPEVYKNLKQKMGV